MNLFQVPLWFKAISKNSISNLYLLLLRGPGLGLSLG